MISFVKKRFVGKPLFNRLILKVKVAVCWTQKSPINTGIESYE